MRRQLTDEEMEREIKRAKRFIDISFGLSMILAAAVVILLLLWCK